tara:strand:+ start:579 stop:1184 length:606 start_codon:yes stop_codon:yes gene_type:complete
MSQQIQTMNLVDSGEGYVPLAPSAPPDVQPPPMAVASSSLPQSQGAEAPTTAFHSSEKNVAQQQQQQPMDSTPLDAVMMEHGGPPAGGTVMMDPPVIQNQSPMQSLQMQAPAQNPTGPVPQDMQTHVQSKNPGGLTDDQMTALFVAVCTAAAISSPVQQKLSTSVPKFLNEMGQRSGVGLAATGAVAAALFYFGRSYVIKQ